LKRLGGEDLNWVQQCIAQSVQKKDEKPKEKDPPGRSGKLIIDASVAPGKARTT
jgi:hypothetical protein